MVFDGSAANSATPGSSVVDLATLGQLLEKHRPQLVEFLRRRIDRGMAIRVAPEDIFQEACIVAQGRWSEFRRRPDGDARSWLYSLARDQLLTHWRNATRLRRDVRRDEPWPDQSAAELGSRLMGDGPGPRTEAEQREMAARMMKIVDLLSDGDYEIVKLRHFDQLSFKQVGELMAIPENTAAVRYARALKRLRGNWEAAYGEEP